MNRIMYIGEHPKIYDVRMHKHKRAGPHRVGSQ